MLTKNSGAQNMIYGNIFKGKWFQSLLGSLCVADREEVISEFLIVVGSMFSFHTIVMYRT